MLSLPIVTEIDDVSELLSIVVEILSPDWVNEFAIICSPLSIDSVTEPDERVAPIDSGFTETSTDIELSVANTVVPVVTDDFAMSRLSDVTSVSVVENTVLVCKLDRTTDSFVELEESEIGTCVSENDNIALSVERRDSFVENDDAAISRTVVSGEDVVDSIAEEASVLKKILSDLSIEAETEAAPIESVPVIIPSAIETLFVRAFVSNILKAAPTVAGLSVESESVTPEIVAALKLLLSVVGVALLADVPTVDTVVTVVSTEVSIPILLSSENDVLVGVAIISPLSTDDAESTTEKISVSTLTVLAESVIVVVSVEFVATVPERIDCGESNETVRASVSIIALFVLYCVLLSIELLTTLLGEELVLELVTIADSAVCENSSVSANSTSALVAVARIAELSDVANIPTGSSVCACPIETLAPSPTKLTSLLLLLVLVCCCRLASIFAVDVSDDSPIVEESCVRVAESATIISPALWEAYDLLPYGEPE